MREIRVADTARYRLTESACVEALVADWVAWPHTVAPVAQCLHLLNYQLPVLRSFLANPGLHEKSCRDPRLLGGAFVDIPGSRLEEARGLHERMLVEFADNIEFAQALLSFSRDLTSQAKGESLEERYARLPASLRGRVELLYDYFNHPLVRCLEGHMYRSGFHQPRLQSLRLFDLRRDADRSYFMSTPRLSGEDSISWKIPFDDTRLDALFRMDVEPGSREQIGEMIGPAMRESELFKRLFRQSTERCGARWRGEGLRIRYFGHACALVETRGVAFLVDALVAPRPHEIAVDRFSYADLPEHIDYVLITHGHHDHFVIETLLRLRHRIGTLVVPKNSNAFYADFSLRLLAGSLGFREVCEVESFDELAFDGGRILAVPFLGEHNDLPSAKTAYLVEAGGKSVLFAADSNCLDAAVYEPLHELAGPVSAAFIGMESVGAPLSWVYGPMLPIKPDYQQNQDRRSSGCNSERASRLAAALRCQRVFVYAVGREPWLKYLLALNPAEDDAYMKEINPFLAGLNRDCGIEARMLFGKAEIFI